MRNDDKTVTYKRAGRTHKGTEYLKEHDGVEPGGMKAGEVNKY